MTERDPDDDTTALRQQLHRALFYDHGGQDVFSFANSRLTLQDDPYLPELLDALLPVVTSWDWLMAVLAVHYPADVFVGGPGADPGPQIVALTREVDRLRRMRTYLAQQLGHRGGEMPPDEELLWRSVYWIEAGLRSAVERSGEPGKPLTQEEFVAELGQRRPGGGDD